MNDENVIKIIESPKPVFVADGQVYYYPQFNTLRHFVQVGADQYKLVDLSSGNRASDIVFNRSTLVTDIEARGYKYVGRLKVHYTPPPDLDGDWDHRVILRGSAYFIRVQGQDVTLLKYRDLQPSDRSSYPTAAKSFKAFAEAVKDGDYTRLTPTEFAKYRAEFLPKPKPALPRRGTPAKVRDFDGNSITPKFFEPVTAYRLIEKSGAENPEGNTVVYFITRGTGQVRRMVMRNTSPQYVGQGKPGSDRETADIAANCITVFDDESSGWKRIPLDSITKIYANGYKYPS